MTGDFSTAVRREYAGGNARFDFPIRPLGWGRLVGLFLLGFGLVFIGLPGRMAWASFQELRHPDHDTISMVFNILFCVFPLLFVVVGFLPLGVGLLVLFGRCRVDWKNGRLRSTEIVGPFRWTRRMPPGRIRKLEVSVSSSQSGTGPRRPMEKFSGLMAEFEDGSEKGIVTGYPKAWLLALASELRGLTGGGTVTITDSSLEEPPEESGEELVPPQPADSPVRVEEMAGGVKLTIPPAGLWKGSSGLFVSALVWCGFMSFFTVMMLKSDTIRDFGLLLAILAGFWAIGIGLLTAAIYLGRRQAELSAVGGLLRIEAKGLFGTKVREWSSGDIAAIRVDASNIEVNRRQLLELQIHPRVGRKFGVFAGRKDDELNWMAARLRQALKVPAKENAHGELNPGN